MSLIQPLQFDWLNFYVHLPSLDNYLKQLDGFVGIMADQDHLGIALNRQHDQQDIDYINNYLQSLTEESEQLKLQSQQQQEYISKLVANARVFGQLLMEEFATENVMLGITQAGLTADVLSLMEERVSVNELKPEIKVSVIGTIQSGSLHETIKTIDFHISKAELGEYDHLAPFITPSRLGQFKQKIIDYL